MIKGLMYSHGKIIKYYRERLHLSSEEFAGVVGITTSQLNAIELDKESIMLVHLPALNEIGISNKTLEDGIVALSPDQSSFQLPDEFNNGPQTDGKYINIFRDYFISKLGSDSWDVFLRSKNISPLRFVNENNKVSTSLVKKIFSTLSRHQVFSVDEIVRFANNEKYCLLKGQERSDAIKKEYLDNLLSTKHNIETSTISQLENSADGKLTISIYTDKNKKYEPNAERVCGESFESLIKASGLDVVMSENSRPGSKNCVLQIS